MALRKGKPRGAKAKGAKARLFDEDAIKPNKDGAGVDENGVVTMRGRFGRVVSYFDAFDVTKEADAVLKAIETPVDKDSSDAIRAEVERSARLTYKAATLADLATREYRDVKDRATAAIAQWKIQAQEYLAIEKEAGRVPGQVTVGMVMETVAILQPQPYSDAVAELHDAELMRSNMANLYAMARERMWNLRGLGGFRGGTPYEDASRETRRGEDF